MFTVNEIAKACGGKIVAADGRAKAIGVSSDSRTVRSGDLFVALKGERFDGHAFVSEALKRGAACALLDRQAGAGMPSVVVGDTLKALQALAKFHRARFSIPVVAVTGSVGKTTTKECISAVLARSFRVCTGFGNFNNHIGLPLNLFKLSDAHECLVLELGANHAGEIALLASIAQPTVGVITGIHPVHLEGFGSLEAVYRAKLELAAYLKQTNGAVIANADDSELLGRLKADQISPVTFGRHPNSDYRLSDVQVREDSISFKVNGVDFHLNGYGAFNAMNALAALATAGHFRADLKQLSQTWHDLPAIPGRFQVQHWASRDIQIVDDSYNANPDSFREAVNSFSALAGSRRKVIVLGDMLELGSEAHAYHEALGKHLAEKGFSLAIGVGPMSRAVLDILDGTTTAHFPEAKSAAQFLVSALEDQDAILIKGSHGMRLDQVKCFLDDYIKRTATLV